jgi:hypothetical protein
MKQPFALIPSTGSSDTAHCLEALCRSVREKRLIGLAYVAIYQQRHYEVHLCGEAGRSPAFTRGALGALEDKLSRLQHGEDA